MRTFLAALICSSLAAQAPPPDLDETARELMELLNTPVTVASKKATTIREQPGIVSLVTRQEIQASGARDLIDILNLVPGFAFAKDTQGTTGVAIRGLSGFEGKILLLVDGMELNEPLYGTTSLENHISADVIQRVEIIRGPGSAIYGGSAELAVINVVTRGADDIKNAYFAQGLGLVEGTQGRRSASMAVATTFPHGKLSLSLASLRAPQSNKDYQDIYGNTYDMTRQSHLSSTFASLGVEWQGLQFRGLLDSYSIEQRDHWSSEILPNAVTQRWDSYYLDLRKSFKLGETLTLTPFLRFQRQFPWASDPVRTNLEDPDEVYSSNRRVDKTTGGLQATWDPSDAVSLLAGGEGYNQKGRQFYRDGSEPTPLANFTGSALYAQGLLKTPMVNVTLGARYERHSRFESSFVPRLGLTKVWDRLHMKLLITRAFRTPFVENININPDLKPEKTSALELEVGYQVGKQSYLVMNLFDTTVKRPIVYYVDGNNDWADAYANFDKLGSRGAEVEYRLQHSRGTLQASYSYYQNNGTNAILYLVPQDEKSLLAFPRHKVVLTSTFRLAASWNLYGGLVHLGERWAWQHDPADSEGRLAKLPAASLLNLVLGYRGLLPGLELSLGAYNALGHDYKNPLPYGNWDNVTNRVTGFQPPRPAQPRELLLKVAYSF